MRKEQKKKGSERYACFTAQMLERAVRFLERTRPSRPLTSCVPTRRVKTPWCSHVCALVQVPCAIRANSQQNRAQHGLSPIQ